MNKSNKAEITRRVRTVAEYPIQDYSASDIVQNVTTACGIKKRQAENYLTKAYKPTYDDTLKVLLKAKSGCSPASKGKS